jgi:hypothetical protein
VDEPVLWSPGACIVVLANRNGRLEVAVSPTQPNGSVGARIKLIPLSNNPAPAKEAFDSAAEPFDPSRIQILGHIAGVGDKVVRVGEWIAGPTSPSRIEGIAIEWPNKPNGVDLRYAVRVGGATPGTTRALDVGSFAGTRGRSAPLVGATLNIGGPNAGGYQLVADAMFLGAPQIRIAGQHIVLSGPTGREPMVGLRLAIERANGSSRTGEPAGAAPADVAEPRPAPEPIRVVRAQRPTSPPAVEPPKSTAADTAPDVTAKAADPVSGAPPARSRNEVRIFRKRDNDDRQLAARDERLAGQKNPKRVRPIPARKKARQSGNTI